MKKRALPIAALAIHASISAAAHAQVGEMPPDYMMVPVVLGDLGRVPEFPERGGATTWPSVGPRIINDAGQVVGFAPDTTTAAHTVRALVWDPAGATFPAAVTLSDLGDYGRAFGINRRGQIVGVANAPNDPVQPGERPVVWDPTGPGTWGPPTSLELLGNGAYPYGINDSGQVVGYVYALGVVHAALWEPTGPGAWGPPTLLPAIGGNAVAHAINNAGIIVGIAGNALGSRETVVMWDAAAPQIVTTLTDPGSALYDLADINDAGQVIGSVNMALVGQSLDRRGVIWDPASPSFPAAVMLGHFDDYTVPRAINESGKITGFVFKDMNRGVVWDAASPTGKPSFLPVPDLAQQAAFGVAINDAGWITGTMTDNIQAGQLWNPAQATPDERSGFATQLLNAGTTCCATPLAINNDGAVVGLGAAPDGDFERAVALYWFMYAPRPILTAISPDLVRAGAPAFTLHVTGMGFVRRSRVMVDGVWRTTTFIDGDHLSAEIPASVVANVGPLSVQVFTPEYQGGGSSVGAEILTVGPKALATAVGPDVTVRFGRVYLVFSSVTAAGDTQVEPVDPLGLGGVPGEFRLDGALPAYEITTSATYTGPVTVCMVVPELTDEAVFQSLEILHGEGGVLVPRTLAEPSPLAPDFATRTLCAEVASLSPFVVAIHEPEVGPDAGPEESEVAESGPEPAADEPVEPVEPVAEVSDATVDADSADSADVAAESAESAETMDVDQIDAGAESSRKDSGGCSGAGSGSWLLLAFALACMVRARAVRA